MARELMIGKIEFLCPPEADLFPNATGGFVNMLTFADSWDDFIARVRLPLEALSLQVIAGEDIEPWADRMARCQPAEGIIQLAEDVQKNPSHVRYATFHTWSTTQA